MKEIIMYTLENKMMYVLMFLIAALFYVLAINVDHNRKKPILKKNIMTVVVTSAMTIMGMVGFLEIMLG